MTGARRSLRARMLWRVLPPLAATWLIGSAIALWLSWIFAGQAFDRALLENTYAIAANIDARDGQPVLDLSAREIENVLFDRNDRQYLVVLDADGHVRAGDAGLATAATAASGHSREFSNSRLRGEPIRLATLHGVSPVPYTVVVGQTTGSRTRLLRAMLIRSIAPQVVLLLLLGAWLWSQIARELAPLAVLQGELERRDSSELGPVRLAPMSQDVERLSDAINALLARIARGVQAQREFAGNVAHDLRTPLAGIRALAEYGLARDDPPVWRRQLASIVASEERASRLVEQLLALALADEARDSIRLEVVAVDELVRRVLLGFMARADATGSDLGATGLDAPVHAWASPALLEGVLVNLIDNALRYGRSGETATITVEVESGDETVSIAVVDQGPGIAAAQRDRPARRWEHGLAVAEPGAGAGLGLAIASRYAELLQSRLRLEPGAGGRGLRAVLALRASRNVRIDPAEAVV